MLAAEQHNVPGQVYAELTPKPIAAASLGQVYKGRLKSGQQVAVKVQRPYVVETVSIDLFIIRHAPLVCSAVHPPPGVCWPTVGLCICKEHRKAQGRAPCSGADYVRVVLDSEGWGVASSTSNLVLIEGVVAGRWECS